MKKFYLISIITGAIIWISSGNFIKAQCPAGSTNASLNWDNLDYLSQTGTYTGFVTNTMLQSQKFTLGRNRLTINLPASITTVGENTTNTAEAGSYGTGADVEYNGNGSITITFDTVVYNVQFSIYDVDLAQTVRVTATDPLSGALNINMSSLLAGVVTVTGSGGTLPLATASGIVAANNDTRGTINISIVGNLPVGTRGVKVITITAGGTAGNFWLSDISACVFGSFPINYYLSQKPWVGQPAYYLVTPDNNSVYLLNPLTGVAQWMFSEPASPWVNSMAYDPVNHFLYYVMDHASPVSTNKSLKKYDFNTETISTIIPDLTTFGVPLFDMVVESAGAAFYNGSLFLGVEGTNSTKTSNRKSIIWRIDFDASQNPVQASQAFAQLTDNGTGLLTHDWGDFTIKDGILYDFNTGNSGSTSQFVHFNMQTGATTIFPTSGNPAPIQAGQTWDGTIYWTGGQGSETGRVAKYNENGTIGPKVITTVTACSPPWVGRAGDASDPFKPKSDFGDAPASYDPVPDDKATHEYDCNLRLGNTFDREWDKTSSANASADGSDEDGISVVTVLAAGVANFVQNISVYNNTGADATLAGWLDYNGNGKFDAPEGKTLIIPTSGSVQLVTLSWTGIPVPMQAGTFTFLRIRITSATNGMSASTPNNWFANGEVEDYMVPVDFILKTEIFSFEARDEGYQVDVAWKSGKEINFSGFEVEKSADGHQWEIKESVPGTIGNDVINEYHSYDEHPFPGKTFYRLKLLYSDGHSSYSDIRMVQREGIGAWLKIAPNPVLGKADLHFNLEKAESATIQILSINGLMVLQHTMNSLKGMNSMAINEGCRLSPGVYIVQLKTSSTTLSKKMIIQN